MSAPAPGVNARLNSFNPGRSAASLGHNRKLCHDPAAARRARSPLRRWIKPGWQKSKGGEIRIIDRGIISLIITAVGLIICYSAPAFADANPGELWVDVGTGVSVGGTSLNNADIGIAAFARYRLNRWEIIGGGWHSSQSNKSNVTVGGGYIVPIWRGLSFIGGLAIAGKSANVGTHGRFYLSGRYDFRCWSIGYIHFSNGMSAFNHDRGPNTGVDLFLIGRMVRC
ncbi:MAG: hypothetical protein V3V64_10080 [Acidiferrobacterales bacterium]|jgi:hypothetical protein|nr:hypothetical protein [Nitrospira sp.]